MSSPSPGSNCVFKCNQSMVVDHPELNEGTMISDPSKIERRRLESAETNYVSVKSNGSMSHPIDLSGTPMSSNLVDDTKAAFLGETKDQLIGWEKPLCVVLRVLSQRELALSRALRSSEKKAIRKRREARLMFSQ
ncbi:hypothetical protein G5714_002693 [Onychostoma macrolepis]|uniref:Uncharacterized protein n=1 Tax=Onychostoma macrolepis TaxID=369639 RepID=A0A7J6D8I7_9TELE|nr:hypothetical protein G5714_002693 [Onychostoma macrolepis]